MNCETEKVEPVQITEDSSRIIRRINTSTVLYGVGEIVFVNSYMLLYFKALGLSSERILLFVNTDGYAVHHAAAAARYPGRIGVAKTWDMGVAIRANGTI